MKKWIGMLLAVVLAAGALAGCGEKPIYTRPIEGTSVDNVYELLQEQWGFERVEPVVSDRYQYKKRHDLYDYKGTKNKYISTLTYTMTADKQGQVCGFGLFFYTYGSSDLREEELEYILLALTEIAKFEHPDMDAEKIEAWINETLGDKNYPTQFQTARLQLGEVIYKLEYSKREIRLFILT